MKEKKYKLKLSESKDLKNEIYIFYPKGMMLDDLPLNQEEMVNWFARMVKPK